MKARYHSLMMFAFVALSVLVFLGTAYAGRAKISEKSHQLVDLKLQSKTADDQLTSLAAAKKQLQKYSYFNDVVKTVLPNDKDQAQAVLDIFQMAAASGIALQNIQFPTSTLGGRATAPATTTPATTTSPTASSTANSSLTQAKPVSGIPGLYSLQLTITPQTGAQVPAASVTTYPKFLDFLNRIERDRRTAQITDVTVSPQTDGSLNFTLVINIFLKP